MSWAPSSFGLQGRVRASYRGIIRDNGGSWIEQLDPNCQEGALEGGSTTVLRKAKLG